MGLLGHILALKAGTDYETLVKTRICGPLHMNSTQIRLSAELQSRLARGHDDAGKAVANWDLPTLAGAGALRSTVNDLLRFLAANLQLVKSGLYPAMRRTHETQNATGVADLSIGLGWHVLGKYGTEIIWHNGGTGGYHSFIGFDKTRRTGVAVLSNSATDIDDIGFHLLENQYPLTRYDPPKQRKEIALEPKVSDAYVGQYELAPNFVLTISKDGDRLMAQASGQPRVQIFAETEADFFYKVVDAQISFKKNDQGQVTHLILHQNGQDMPAKRISDAVPTEVKRQAVELNPKVYDGYVGQYELAPNFILTISKDANRLMAQATGQPRLELLPQSRTEFFFKEVDAQVTFGQNEKGETTHLILHQNGDHLARRLK